PDTVVPDTVVPDTAVPQTASPATAAVASTPAPALPFVAQAAPEGRSAVALEAWLDAHLRGEASAPPPKAIRVDPLREAPGPVAEPGADEAPADEAAPPLVTLADYAAVKVRIWDDGLPLLEALAERDIAEATWREHEHRQASELAEELREGRSQQAIEVRRAIREARAARAVAEEAGLMDLEAYAALRVALETLDVELEGRQRLAEEGLTVEAWEAQRDGWTKRVRQDRGARRRLDRALTAARRAHKRGRAAAP
ncbi:MAG: hypothetical protein KC731_01060, partial [Myxococcales bacterium]|nr:hypothetical protein [Myxococcales bacterium]